MKAAWLEAPVSGDSSSSCSQPPVLPGFGAVTFQVSVKFAEPAPRKPRVCSGDFLPSLRSNRTLTCAGPETVTVAVKVSVAGHRPWGLTPETTVAREETRGTLPAGATMPGGAGA